MSIHISRIAYLFLLLLLNDNSIIQQVEASVRGCPTLNYCSGNGKCLDGRRCNCYEGFTAADCSKRSCPKDLDWGGIPNDGYGQDARRNIECSGRGICNYDTGNCECDHLYEGKACQRMKCPTKNGLECSGHGRCVTMELLARKSQGQPLTASASLYFYKQNNHTDSRQHATWDANKIQGCLCESSWKVGLKAGQTQLAEYFGPDCSLRRCPSGNDPLTSANETDCENKAQTGVVNNTVNDGVGEAGNLCHIDCSNRGRCNYQTGVCECFKGHYGVNCNTQNVNYKGFQGEVQMPGEMEPIDYDLDEFYGQSL